MNTPKSILILSVLMLVGCLTDTTRVYRSTNNGTTNNGSNNASHTSSTAASNNNSNQGANNSSNNTSTATSTGTTQGPTIVCTEDKDCNGTTCLIDAADATKNICGECRTSSECSGLNASKCDADNLCIACVEDLDCAHLKGTPGCDNGQCHECTKEEHCDGYACNLADHVCTDQF